MKLLRTIGMLALALAVTSAGYSRAPKSADDDADVSLVGPASGKASGESFGARMAHARASKGSGNAKGAKSGRNHKAKAAKSPRIPKAPVTDGIGD